MSGIEFGIRRLDPKSAEVEHIMDSILVTCTRAAESRLRNKANVMTQPADI